MGIDGVKGIGDMKIAEIRNLSYSYRENCGQKKAVSNVSFDIDEGECLGLIGESGSGKSTIGSLIGNFLTGYEGSIHLMSNEKELTDMSKKERHDLYRDIQVVFQNPWQSFPPNMCVGEGIAEGIRYYSRGLASDQKKLKEKVLETMHLVGLSASYYQKKCRELSGGECQRAAIGRAIIRSPRLLICDEVTSALDVSIQAQVVNLMKDIQAETQCAYLFIAHDLSMVKYISDRIGVLHLGYMVESGTKEEIFSHPVHPYTKSLLSAIPHPNPVVEKHRVALTYNYATSGIDYAKGTEHSVGGTHTVLATDEEFDAWTK